MVKAVFICNVLFFLNNGTEFEFTMDLVEALKKTLEIDVRYSYTLRNKLQSLVYERRNFDMNITSQLPLFQVQ